MGKSIPVASINKEDLSGANQEVLGTPSYRDTAHRFQRTIAQTNGVDRVADVLERAFQLVDESGVAVWENPLDTDAHSPLLRPVVNHLSVAIQKGIRHHSLHQVDENHPSQHAHLSLDCLMKNK